jgi:hypothetical protein
MYCRQMISSKLRYCEPVAKFLGFDDSQKDPTDTKKHFKNFPIFYKTLNPEHWSYSKLKYHIEILFLEAKWKLGHKRRNIDYMIKTKS